MRNVNRWGRMLRYVETCLLNKKADNKTLFWSDKNNKTTCQSKKFLLLLFCCGRLHHGPQNQEKESPKGENGEKRLAGLDGEPRPWNLRSSSLCLTRMSALRMHSHLNICPAIRGAVSLVRGAVPLQGNHIDCNFLLPVLCWSMLENHLLLSTLVRCLQVGNHLILCPLVRQLQIGTGPNLVSISVPTFQLAAGDLLEPWGTSKTLQGVLYRRLEY